MATCEVCSTLGWPQKGPGKRVLVGERLVTLCASHARVLPSLPTAGVSELRGVFKEKRGKRSLIDRRQGLMWQVGDLMHQWEELQALSDRTATADA